MVTPRLTEPSAAPLNFPDRLVNERLGQALRKAPQVRRGFGPRFLFLAAEASVLLAHRARSVLPDGDLCH